MPAIDRAYLAMEAAVRAMADGCPCGCLEDARDGLIQAMRELEGMVSTSESDCCGGGGCHCR